jgi:hypothetical protein
MPGPGRVTEFEKWLAEKPATKEAVDAAYPESRMLRYMPHRTPPVMLEVRDRNAGPNREVLAVILAAAQRADAARQMRALEAAIKAAIQAVSQGLWPFRAEQAALAAYRASWERE